MKTKVIDNYINYNKKKIWIQIMTGKKYNSYIFKIR